MIKFLSEKIRSLYPSKEIFKLFRLSTNGIEL